MTVYITIGAPASGKSYWAQNRVKMFPNTMIVCRDDIRAAMSITKFGDPKTEQLITKIQRAQMEGAFLAGLDVIVADTNLNKDFRKSLIKFCHEHAQDVYLFTFKQPLDILIMRDAQRERTVGSDVIKRMYDQMQNYQGESNEFLPAPKFSDYEHSLGEAWKPSAIVVDIDGTVADKGKRDAYNEKRVSEDTPIWDVVDVIGSLHESGDYSIVFVSGRTDGCEADTREWIEKVFGFDTTEYVLYMRKSGDVRPDYIIKGEIYDEKVIPNWNIKMVFDDRDQVVRHVRKRGITVAQVAPGRF
jgi:predicted kinase